MGKKVLIIDDEPDITAGLRTLLEFEGFETASASSGVEGLEKFRQLRPEMVIMDVMMPGRDGFETLVLMREVDPNVPVVLMSAVSHREKLQRHGPDGFLRKPFSLDAVVDVVNRLTAQPRSAP